MGLPTMKKSKPMPSWTHAQLDLVEKIAKLLGADASLSAIYQALENRKADVDQLRFFLNLTPSVTELYLVGIAGRINDLKEAANLEAEIQEVLKAYPFKRARLRLTIANAEGRSSAYEASLSAQEMTDAPPYSRMPMVEVIEMREKKTALLDRSIASTMVTAVKGLKP